MEDAKKKYGVELPEHVGACEMGVEEIMIILCALDCFEDFLREHDEGERADTVMHLYWQFVETTGIPSDPKTAYAQFQAAGEVHH